MQIFPQRYPNFRVFQPSQATPGPIWVLLRNRLCRLSPATSRCFASVPEEGVRVHMSVCVCVGARLWLPSSCGDRPRALGSLNLPTPSFGGKPGSKS